MTLFEFLICIALIGTSAYMSSSEIALFSLSRFQLRQIKDNFPTAYRKIKRLLSDPGGLIITIAVLNECVNIGLSTVIAEIVARNWSTQDNWLDQHLPQRILHVIPPWAAQTVVGILITTPVLLFFSEITPKIIGARINQVVAPATARPLLSIYNAFKPIRLALKKVIRGISQLIRAPGGHGFEAGASGAPLREEDFLVMLEEGHKEGAIEQSELELIRNVFELDDTTVQDVYTPLSKVFTLQENTPLKTALTWLRDYRYFRIPVTAQSKKKVLGVLYVKDLLRAKMDPTLANMPISELMHKPITVSQSARLNAVFRKLKQSKTHMAIVENDRREATGVITMDDILDVLFDELLAPDDELDGPHPHLSIGAGAAEVKK